MPNNLSRPIGRIICRGPKTAGLWLPYSTATLEGIYEVREVLGDMTIVALRGHRFAKTRFHALDLDGLHAERPWSAMTEAEIAQIKQRPVVFPARQ